MTAPLIRFDRKSTYVFVDCETLNLALNSCHNLPWQIAMIKCRSGKSGADSETLDSKDFLIKWDTNLKISDDAARITRYSQETVDRKGKPPEEIFATVKEWLDDADYIVGHNVLGFDLYLIKDLYKHFGFCYKHLVSKILDTNALARGVKSNFKYDRSSDLMEYQYCMNNRRIKGIKTNLKALGQEFGIEHDYEKLHNALVDLELNIKVWDKIKYQIDI